MRSFNEIYLLNLHGNVLKKEKCPDGSKDENVFDIRQGVAIGLFVKNLSLKRKLYQRNKSRKREGSRKCIMLRGGGFVRINTGGF